MDQKKEQLELRANAMMLELQQQRDMAFARATYLAADLASMGRRVEELEAKLKVFEEATAKP